MAKKFYKDEEPKVGKKSQFKSKVLSKKNRLNRKEIDELKSQKNRVIQGKFFGLIFQKEAGENAFALIISNKVVPGAVKRNRVRRLFFRAIEESFPHKEGKFLFLAKKTCLAASLPELKGEMINFGNNITP